MASPLQGWPPPQPEQQPNTFQTPPPAQPSQQGLPEIGPGFAGDMGNRMPLPTGGTFLIDTPSDPNQLLPEELETLKKIPGWEPGMPVSNEVLQKVEELSNLTREEAMEIPPEIQAAMQQPSKPLEVSEPVPFESLSDTKKREVQEALDRAAAMKAQQDNQVVANAMPGVNEALNAPVRQVDAGIVNDLHAQPAQSQPQPQPKTQPQAPSDQDEYDPPKSRTGADQPLRTHCPHCGWDLNETDPIDVTEEDRLVFLQAILGGLPFQKTYELFGGKLAVTFRSLTIDEIDKIYMQVDQDARKEKLGDMDRVERLMHYRLCLQLKTLFGHGINETLPDSLAQWQEGQQVPEGQATLLPQIATYMRANVVTHESLARVLATLRGRFDRLMAKLEVQSDRPDFWSETVLPS